MKKKGKKKRKKEKKKRGKERKNEADGRPRTIINYIGLGIAGGPGALPSR